MKRNTMGKIEEFFIKLFFGVCVIGGLFLGANIGFCLACVVTDNSVNFHRSLNDMPGIKGWAFVFGSIGIVLGAVCIGVPLFFICVKTFYSRQAIVDLIDRNLAPSYYSGNSVNLVNKIGEFWLNFVYSDEAPKDRAG